MIHGTVVKFLGPISGEVFALLMTVFYFVIVALFFKHVDHLLAACLRITTRKIELLAEQERCLRESRCRQREMRTWATGATEDEPLEIAR